MKKAITVLSVICFFYCCTRQHKKSILSFKTSSSFLTMCPELKGKKYLVYYFDGDCSFCIAKILNVQKEAAGKKEYGVLLVARTFNPELLAFNLKQYKISSCIIYEKHNDFNNELMINHVMCVEKNREIFLYDL